MERERKREREGGLGDGASLKKDCDCLIQQY